VIQQETKPKGWTLSSVQPPEGFIQHTCTADDGQVIRRGGVRSATTGEEILAPPPPGTKSYCELLVERDEGACVGQANGFISHVWMLCFRKVLASLTAGLLSNDSLVKLDGLTSEKGRLGTIVRYVSAKDRYLVQLRGEEGQQKLLKAESLLPMHDDVTEVYLWLDICVINEHWPERFSKGFSDTFVEAVGDIGHTLLILTPWDQPVVLSRSWCLWELYCTEQKGCELTICLTNEQRQAFLDAARYDLIEERVGFEALDGMIFARLRDWALDAQQAAVAEARTLAGGARATTEALDAARAAASQLKQQGRLEEAAALYLEVMVGYEALQGPTGRETLSAKNCYAIMLEQQDKMEEAGMLYREVIEGQTATKLRPLAAPTRAHW